MSMDGRHELARGKREKDTGGEIVFAYPVSELEIGLEHCTKWQGDRLWLFSGMDEMNWEQEVELTLRRT